MNLYEIDTEIFKCIDEETGEIFDFEKLDNLALERDRKIENICMLIKNYTAQAEALKAEKQAFETRRKSAEGKAEQLKRYITNYLAGATFETTKIKISYRKSQALEIDEGTDIPSEYLKAPEVNASELKAAIKSGLELDGVRLVDKSNIQIK